MESIQFPEISEERQCSSCGASLREEAKFCNYCGTQQSQELSSEAKEVICPSCGSKEGSSDRKFCGKCGFSISSEFSQEREYDSVVLHNLEMLRTKLNDALKNESIGINAGFTKIDGELYSCGAFNGCIDENGRIVIFGNLGTVEGQTSEDISKYPRFTLKVATDVNKLKLIRSGAPMRGFFKIVESINQGGLSERALETLKDAIDEWNREQESNFTSLRAIA
jgi:hypothetical protein